MARPRKSGFASVRIKGKPREVDLSRSGVGLGKVRIDVSGSHGHLVVEIKRIDEDTVDNMKGGDGDEANH